VADLMMAHGSDAMQKAKEALVAALSDLEELRSEYESKRDNLPENLSDSPYYQKCDAVADLDIESSKDTAEGLELDIIPHRPESSFLSFLDIPSKPRKKVPSMPSRWADAAGHATESLEFLKTEVQHRLDALREMEVDADDETLEGDEKPDLSLEEINKQVDKVEELVQELEQLESEISEFEGAELPLGFGRD